MNIFLIVLALAGVESLELRMREQRAAGEFEAALQSAREWVSILSAEIDSTNVDGREQLDDARRELVTLRAIDGFDASRRAALRQGDQLGRQAYRQASRGDFEAAYRSLREQIELLRKLFGPMHPESLHALNTLAAFAHAAGDYAASERALRASLAGNGEVLGPQHSLVEACRQNLASTLRDQGSTEEASLLYREQIRWQGERHGESSVELATSLGSLAALLLRDGEFDECDGLLERAARIYAAQGSEHIPRLADIERLRADLSRARGDLDGAQAHIDRAWSMVEKLDEGSLPRARILHERMRTLALRGELREAAALAPRILELHRRQRGAEHPLVVDALRLRGAIHRAQGEIELAADDLSLAASVFESARRRGGRGLERALFLQSPYAELLGVQHELGRADACWESLQRHCARTLLELMQGASEIVSSRELATRLDPHEALVGWIDTRDLLGGGQQVAFVLRDDGIVHWQHAANSRTPGEIREAMQIAATWPLALDYDALLGKQLERLHAERLAPLQPRLPGVSRLLIVPGGDLASLPWCLMRDPDGHFLVEQMECMEIPSPSLLAVRDRVSTARRSALLIGAVSGTAFAELPFAREELERIHEFWPLSVLRIGDEASERSLREQLRDSRFSILHFATHALIDDRWPMRSRILLSESAQAAPAISLDAREFDGQLQVAEISGQLGIDADLVVLSSCRSAGGRYVRGEGELGMAQAFLQSGARRLLLSRWAVEDRASRSLMVEFHRRFSAGAGAVAALREAQLGFLRDEAGKPRHPTYWAAFVLCGIPEPRR